jgi:hypothetical protein
VGCPAASAWTLRVGEQRDDPVDGGHDQQELAAHAVGGE